MFFCIGLVFANNNTRVINENTSPDIIVNLKTDDYIVSDAIIDPLTKDNVTTYVLKDNAMISFSFANHNITSSGCFIANSYYRPFKNKTIKIRSREFPYLPGTDVSAIHSDTFDVLKATNRINDCLFTFNISYNIMQDGQEKQKETTMYFKFVSESQYDAYKDVQKSPIFDEDSGGEIRRPKKQK